MARAKRESDVLYNARRRAKRALARIEREIKSGKLKKSRAVQAYRQELAQEIRKSYIGRNPSESRVETARKSAQSLDKYRLGAKASATERRNIIFKLNIKAASAGSGRYTPEATRLFWNATKHAWAGRGRDRYASIAQYYGTDDLQSIFDRVMAENKEALARARSLDGASTIADTADPLSALQQAMGQGVEADGNYPNDYLAYTVPVYAV